MTTLLDVIKAELSASGLDYFPLDDDGCHVKGYLDLTALAAAIDRHYADVLAEKDRRIAELGGVIEDVTPEWRV